MQLPALLFTRHRPVSDADPTILCPQTKAEKDLAKINKDLAKAAETQAKSAAQLESSTTELETVVGRRAEVARVGSGRELG